MTLEIRDWFPRPPSRPPAGGWLNPWNGSGNFTGGLPDIRQCSD